MIVVADDTVKKVLVNWLISQLKENKKILIYEELGI